MKQWIQEWNVHVGDGVHMTMHGLGREDMGECMDSEVKARD